MAHIPTSGTIIEVGGTIATCVAVEQHAAGYNVFVRATKGNANKIFARVADARIIREDSESAVLSVSLEFCVWAKTAYAICDRDSPHIEYGAGVEDASSKQLLTFQRGLHFRLRLRA